FNSALNSYNDLVNRAGPNDFIVPFNVKEGETHNETRTTIKLERSFMRQNLRTFPVIGFGTMPFFYLNDVPAENNYDWFTAHKNTRGLLPRGTQYMTALMKKGMIIEADHMSDDAQQSAMQMLNRYHYPMISGHSNFRELRREANETGGGGKEARLKTEFTIYDSKVNEINDAGGMFGIMTQQNNIRTAENCPVPNNAAGGSSSFAQAYWYVLQKTGGQKGIAFGSDFNGFAPQIAPRFGTEAAFMLEGDDILNYSVQREDERIAPLSNTRTSNVGAFYSLGWYKARRNQAFSQTNGVRYNSPIKTWHYHRFQAPSFLTWEERDIWEAIAIAKSGVQPAQAWQPGGGLSPERTGIQQDKIKNIAEGIRWGLLREPTGDYGAFLECPEYIVRDENLNNCMPERKAAYMAVRGINSLPERMKTPVTMDLYTVINRIYQLWMQFENGPNEPLRRSYAYTGGRDFDFNLDGLAHYGMFPDLIQDLKNNGFNSEQLRPLFMGPEQYLKMWDQADSAKNNVRD
ncbi:MAG TPA: membrane dipeptidase, partial [Chitinophagaceae bacterium]|nr:membrane dipeptidase [Chitinophagaceae bacterium]